MFVPSEDKKGVTMVLVFLPSKNEGNGLVMDFAEVVRFVMEITKEYIQKHPIPKQSKIENDRFMVS
jgi:6-pyruvoyl-tetrahydropterin synthase